MANDLALIIPAAGRGSRFAKDGIPEPKPLIDLEGRPFFWWATESVRRTAKLRQLVYVVLQEHIDRFAIDARIKACYPQATIVAIPEVTSGAAETASLGLQALSEDGPVAINDCDHAFVCSAMPQMVSRLAAELDGALMCFRSTSPSYSYVQLDERRRIVGTVEKKVASPYAIAGCYFFSQAKVFAEYYERYKKECPYDELFVSGMFNLIAKHNQGIGLLEVDRHVSFGTPEERARVSSEAFAPFLGWK
jgi:CTP:molybdopterin cytidylyltransferase MocA